jgi:hypothetical protein
MWFWEGGPTIPVLAIRDDIGSEELRWQARRESDGRVSARLIAIANAPDRASAARLAMIDRPIMARAEGDVVGDPRLCGQPQTGPALDAANGAGSDLPAPDHEQGRSAQGLSLPAWRVAI